MEKKKQKKHFWEAILSVFAWLSLFLAVLMSVITVFAAFSGEQNGKEVFGHKLLIVTSNSMSKSALSDDEEIFFSAGDIIAIQSIEDGEVFSEGDVITFQSLNPENYGKTVTHKIREVKYSPDGKLLGYVTYGINTCVNDMVMVKPETVIGKYSFKIPMAGHLFSFLKTQRGYYLSIIVPAVLLIIFFSIRVGKTLGRSEYARLYNAEVESLDVRVTNLERRPSVISRYAPISLVPSVDASRVRAETESSEKGSGFRITSVMASESLKNPTSNRIKFNVSSVSRREDEIRFSITKSDLPDSDVSKESYRDDERTKIKLRVSTQNN